MTAHDAAMKCTHHTRSAAIWQEISRRVEDAKRQEQIRDLTGVFINNSGLIPTMSEQKLTTEMLHAGIKAVLDELDSDGEPL